MAGRELEQPHMGHEWGGAERGPATAAAHRCLADGEGGGEAEGDGVVEGDGEGDGDGDGVAEGEADGEAEREAEGDWDTEAEGEGVADAEADWEAGGRQPWAQRKNGNKEWQNAADAIHPCLAPGQCQPDGD